MLLPRSLVVKMHDCYRRALDRLAELGPELGLSMRTVLSNDANMGSFFYFSVTWKLSVNTYTHLNRSSANSVSVV